MNYTGNVQESRKTAECSLAAAVSSSVLTFLAMAIVIFIAGFAVGRYFRFSQHCKRNIITTDPPYDHQDPVYVDTQPSTEENLELKVNLAYSDHYLT